MSTPPNPPAAEPEAPAALPLRKPEWLKVRMPGGEGYAAIKQIVSERTLHTVCQSARCPNIGECWASGTATFMVLGNACTRHCRYCAVPTGNPRGVLDPQEPAKVAESVELMRLSYAVITGVDRDDLADGGASHWAAVVRAVRARNPKVVVELLVGDFQENYAAIDAVLASEPEVYGHNIEVVERISPSIRDRRADYRQSLRTLKHAKARAPKRLTKSAIMVGIGETDDEVVRSLNDLREHDVDLVAIGQFLSPENVKKFERVQRYVHPDQFREWKEYAESIGFLHCASGPLVRSSYHAADGFTAADVKRHLNETGGNPGSAS